MFGVGYFGNGGYVYGLPDLFAELAPVALIALAALGGVDPAGRRPAHRRAASSRRGSG